MSGMARTLLHLGDLRGGKALAQQLNSSSLWKECAGILEQMHQHQDAAEMYEQAGMAEKAAGIYIAARNWAAAAPLMQQVTSAKLQLQYAKAKEGEGSYADAVAAYEAAGAWWPWPWLCITAAAHGTRACELMHPICHRTCMALRCSLGHGVHCCLQLCVGASTTSGMLSHWPLPYNCSPLLTAGRR